jgi:outer membrane lipoprotein SlyB
MKSPLILLASSAGLLLAGCTFPSSRNTIKASQAGVLQSVDTGMVIGVREVTIEGQKSQLGMYGGGLMGGAASSAVGQGVGKSIATATGAVGGAIVGQAVEEVATRKRAQEVTIRMDDGRTVIVTQEVQGGLYQDGDRVRVIHANGEARIAMSGS